jgi:hypothetical protein
LWNPKIVRWHCGAAASASDLIRRIGVTGSMAKPGIASSSSSLKQYPCAAHMQGLRDLLPNLKLWSSGFLHYNRQVDLADTPDTKF